MRPTTTNLPGSSFRLANMILRERGHSCLPTPRLAGLLRERKKKTSTHGLCLRLRPVDSSRTEAASALVDTGFEKEAIVLLGEGETGPVTCGQGECDTVVLSLEVFPVRASPSKQNKKRGGYDCVYSGILRDDDTKQNIEPYSAFFRQCDNARTCKNC